MIRGHAARGLLFRYLIEQAAHKATPWNVAGKMVELQRGQLFTTRNRISQDTGLSIKQVRLGANQMRDFGMISVEPRANRGVLITVVNYDKYQDRAASGADQGNDQGNDRGADRGVDIKQEDKKVVKQEGKKDIPSALRAPGILESLPRLRAALASTRKSNRIAESVWFRTLDALSKHSPEAVRHAIDTYLRSGHHLQGKDERYLLGIARGAGKQDARGALSVKRRLPPL